MRSDKRGLLDLFALGIFHQLVFERRMCHFYNTLWRSCADFAQSKGQFTLLMTERRAGAWLSTPILASSLM